MKTTKLKSGVSIMGRPAIPEDFSAVNDQEIIDLLKHKAPGQPITFVSFHEAQRLCTSIGGRLPTEEEWLESFNNKPYFGGILEWIDGRLEAGLYVLRGGSWFDDDPRNPLSSIRDDDHPDGRGNGVGFRVVVGVVSR